MKTIVVPTDFSAISLNAVNYAADMACVINANLSLLHVCQIPVVYSEAPLPASSVTTMITEAEDRLKALREELFHRTGNSIQVLIEVREGDVVTEIEDYCNSLNTYAVIMGAESAGAFERFLLGGKTLAALRNLAWPLIVVPPGVQFTSIKRIGLACDFRDVIETIPVKEIRNLVTEFGAVLHVVHISHVTTESFKPAIVEESGWLQEILGDLKPVYSFIVSDELEKAIGDYAENNKLDLLIVIPKKHGMISRIFQHSNSRQLVLHAHVPVMAIHE